MHCIREQQGFTQAWEKECGFAWSTVRVTVLQRTRFSLFHTCPKQSQAQFWGKQAISSMFLLQHGHSNTEGARELPDTADIGEKPPQRAQEGRKPPWTQDAQWTAHDRCPLKANHCGRMSIFCSADVPPPGSHSVCMVVTHFPAELGQTMQKVKSGALGARLVLPSHCTRGIMSQLQGGRSDFPSTMDGLMVGQRDGFHSLVWERYPTTHRKSIISLYNSSASSYSTALYEEPRCVWWHVQGNEQLHINAR